MSEEPHEIDPLLGRVVLGRYRLVRELARGGMGAIYLARSEGAASFVKPVVVKRMLPEFIGDAEAAKMFKREARIMSTLRHPGIVSVFDFGREDSGYMLVMDYVHGFHLGRWAGWVQQQRGEVPVAVAVHVVAQVLDALHYAHTLQGPDGESLHIVHRDVSPSNVLLDVSGHVRLADFGIAQSQADAPDVKTSTRTVKGKFSYLAPEILEGATPTPSSDVYSAAVVLHEVLLGRNEFRTASPTGTVGRVLGVTPTRLDAVRSDVSREIADVVAQALEKRPERRFATAAELARALRRARGADAEEASQLLAETFGHDFRDPTLAAMFDLPELDELERAWRLPTASMGSDPPPEGRPTSPRGLRPERMSDEPTTGARGPAGGAGEEAVPAIPPAPPAPSVAVPAGPSVAVPVAAPRTSRVAIAAFVVVAVVAVAAAGTGAWLATRPAEGGPDVVYVQATPAGIETGSGAGIGAGIGTGTGAGAGSGAGTGSGTGTGTGAGAGSGAGTGSEAGSGAGTGSEAGTGASGGVGGGSRTPREDRRTAEEREAAAIQHAFGRHTSRIRECFSSAPPGSPEELVLRFSVDTRGTVQRVELSPAGVAGTTQGQCVMRIAQAIDFPDTSAPRSFRIPIEVRSR